MRCSYKTRGTCSTKITFDLDGDVVRNVEFADGCEGNLRAIGKLVEGFTVDQIIAALGGIRCGFKPTSCGDQLARAVEQARKDCPQIIT
jgi:uncharacterized protein (TIGR03905 family)